MVVTPSFLSVEALNKHFYVGENKISILCDISVCFEIGNSYAIRGASGSGKSTFMHLLAGLDTPTSGAVYYRGNNIFSFSLAEQDYFRQHRIGLMFQLPYLIDELSVEKNVMLPALISGIDRKLAQERAQELLAGVGLADFMYLFPRTLSGGQQQRVALARALINRPEFLLADEPTGSLDEQTGKEVINLILACQQQWPMGVIMSTHDSQVSAMMYEHYVMRNKTLMRGS